MTIHFEKANLSHQDILFRWLAEPHVREVWDNSQNYKDDVLIFMKGRKKPSPYFNGVFSYWIGFKDKVPYALIMTSALEDWGRSLSKKGKTLTLDFAIGNGNYLGQELDPLTLETFMDFYRLSIDQAVNTFFIDPDINDAKARHVYEKIGFRKRGQFKVEEGYFTGHTNLIMVKKFHEKAKN